MKVRISVVIPTYNSSRTIRATLEAVLQQTVFPYEILILDDGSTDDTVSILTSYEPRVTVIQRENAGVASARNELCARASGNLVAFLDHDDIWHPKYLEVQGGNFEENPHAVGFFAGHTNLFGYGSCSWDGDRLEAEKGRHIVMGPIDFLKAYYKTSGAFGSASFLCVPKSVLTKIGREPFGEKVSGVDDGYLCTLLPLMGSVVYCSAPLVAYRIISAAQSTDKVRAFGLWVEVFHMLEDRYRGTAEGSLLSAFEFAHASTRRSYAKRLMGVGRVAEARHQLWISLKDSSDPRSIAKSLALLLLSRAPRPLQPSWPSGRREWNGLETVHRSAE